MKSENKIQAEKTSLEEQQHRAGTTLKCVCAECKLKRRMEKDIRNSEEVKSQKQKQSQYQKSMDQTLNAKMMDENNETFKHDTEFHEFRTACAAGADQQHARMAKEVTQSSQKVQGIQP